MADPSVSSALPTSVAVVQLTNPPMSVPVQSTQWNVAANGFPAFPQHLWQALPTRPIHAKAKSAEYTAAGIAILEAFLQLSEPDRHSLSWMVQAQQNIPASASVHSYFYILHRSDSAYAMINPAKKARTMLQEGQTGEEDKSIVKLTQQGGGTVYHYALGPGGVPVKGSDHVQVSLSEPTPTPAKSIPTPTHTASHITPTSLPHHSHRTRARSPLPLPPHPHPLPPHPHVHPHRTRTRAPPSVRPPSSHAPCTLTHLAPTPDARGQSARVVRAAWDARARREHDRREER